MEETRDQIIDIFKSGSLIATRAVLRPQDSLLTQFSRNLC